VIKYIYIKLEPVPITITNDEHEKEKKKQGATHWHFGGRAKVTLTLSGYLCSNSLKLFTATGNCNLRLVISFVSSLGPTGPLTFDEDRPFICIGGTGHIDLLGDDMEGRIHRQIEVNEA
jgi:hypothetical protein